MLTKKEIMEIAIEASTEAWAREIAEHGSLYVDSHHAEIKEAIEAEVRDAIHEAERDYQRSLELNSYFTDYEPYSAGWAQQDTIDLYRAER